MTGTILSVVNQESLNVDPTLIAQSLDEDSNMDIEPSRADDSTDETVVDPAPSVR